MDCVMIRSSSSEASTCSDFSSPLTPDFGPRVDSPQLKDEVDIQLRLFGRTAEHLPSMTKKLYIASESPQAHPIPVVRRICFIGAGYVGGPTAAMIALHNPWLHVDVVDKSEARIAQWMSRHLPIHEPGLDQVVRLARDGDIDARLSIAHQYGPSMPYENGRAPNLFFSTEVAESVSQADMIFLAVNTPTKTFGRGAGRATNMSAFDACVDEMIPNVKPNAIIVEKSTVPCGSAKRIISKFQARRPDVHIEVLSNPEFLAEGTAMKDLLEPDRIVIGGSRTTSGRMAAEALSQIYSWVPSDRIITSNTWSSELSKLVANAMLAQRISSINSISAICEETGAEVQEISTIIGRDSRIGPKFLQSGLGFGGSCFRKDIASLTYLAQSLGLDEVADYWDSVNSLNVYQRGRFASRIVRRLDDNLLRKKVTILGFAFKKGTGDCRESLTADVVRVLLEEQPAEIAIFDPVCDPADIMREIKFHVDDEKLVSSTVKVYRDPYTACADADAVLIATDCDQFKIPSWPQHAQASYNTKNKNQIDEANNTTITVTISDPSTATTSTRQYTFAPLPPCTRVPCQECQSTMSCSTGSNDSFMWSSLLARVHWPQIIQIMKSPARIFDSRHVLKQEDVQELQRNAPSLIVEWIGTKP